MTAIADARFPYGKYKGQDVHEIARRDASYLRWMLGSTDDADLRATIAAALEVAA